MSAKQAINDKLQGSVATYLRRDEVFNNQIKKGLLLSLWVIFFKSVNVWKSYKQERGCLMHFARLANTLIKDEESARVNFFLKSVKIWQNYGHESVAPLFWPTLYNFMHLCILPAFLSSFCIRQRARIRR